MKNTKQVDSKSPQKSIGKKLVYSDLSLDLNKRTLGIKDKVINLKNKEFFLLKFFMKHPEQVFTRTQLLEAVWERSNLCKTNTVDVHVSILRKSLSGMTDKNFLKTVHCAGYMLKDNGL